MNKNSRSQVELGNENFEFIKEELWKKCQSSVVAMWVSQQHSI